MTQDEIIKMAKQVGLPHWYQTKEVVNIELLEAFAKLVAQREREACAKDCEGINSIEDFYGERPELICAKAIRARGQA